MNGREQPERRILVIANRTCPCPTLADDVARRGSDTPLEVLVVAPALNSRLRHWVSDVDEAVARALTSRSPSCARHQRPRRGWRLAPVVGDRRRAGELRGRGDRDRDTPPGRSNWIERRLVEKARAHFDVPIAHLVSDYGLVQVGSAA
jgi:hypothetical protein